MTQPDPTPLGGSSASTSSAVVTGTSRGIGQAVAAALLDRGWRVLGLARSEAPPGLAGAEGYRHARVDLSDLAALEEWIAGPLAEWDAEVEGTRLGLVNNAAVLEPVGPVHRLAGADLARALAIDVVAPALLTGWALRAAAGRAVRIVDVSSGAATRPCPGWAAYCTGKAALRMLGQVIGGEQALYPEVAGVDLALVSYSPHIVDTEMQVRARGSDPAAFPLRDRFVAMKEQGMLVPAEAPATRIAELLERDGLPVYSEMRFDPEAEGAER